MRTRLGIAERGGRRVRGELDALPPWPQNCLPAEAAHRLHAHLDEVATTREADLPPPPFPEDEIAVLLDNTWTDTGKAVFNNWLGLVYRLTDMERGVPFMAGVDPDDPLGRLRTP